MKTGDTVSVQNAVKKTLKHRVPQLNKRQTCPLPNTLFLLWKRTGLKVKVLSFRGDTDDAERRGPVPPPREQTHSPCQVCVTAVISHLRITRWPLPQDFPREGGPYMQKRAAGDLHAVTDRGQRLFREIKVDTFSAVKLYFLIINTKGESRFYVCSKCVEWS